MRSESTERADISNYVPFKIGNLPRYQHLIFCSYLVRTMYNIDTRYFRSWDIVFYFNPKIAQDVGMDPPHNPTSPWSMVMVAKSKRTAAPQNHLQPS